MRAKCKTCGKNCEGDYCFQHKPRKRISVQNLTNSVKKEDPIRKNIEMKDFFLQIWKDRPHKSEISGVPLGSEPLSTFFHHILPKNKYPESSLDEENIILLTWEEHDQVERDITRYEEVNKRREQLKQKYEIS
jgi:5-methylcytosine-specific restriction endonuclease McrA